MDLDDLFGLDADEPRFTVSTWQYNGPNRVCALGKTFDKEGLATVAAVEWTGVPIRLFTHEHRGQDRDKLAGRAYQQKIGLVLVCQGSSVCCTAPLEGSWMPGGE